MGTEEGWAGETNWSIMRRDEIYPGWERYEELRYGHEDGTHWLPAEVNTSIRPGWYYHPGEDHQVKSLARLVRTDRYVTLHRLNALEDAGAVHRGEPRRCTVTRHPRTRKLCRCPTWYASPGDTDR